MVDQGTFRRAVGRFATGICVLTSLEGRADHATTVSSFASVSLDPSLVLVCVHRDARVLDAITESGVWGVSVLDAGQRPVADWLSDHGRPLVGQFDRIPHRRGPRTGVVLLEEAAATLECRTADLHPAGDHSIVVGEVLAAQADPDHRGALVHHRGAYTRI